MVFSRQVDTASKLAEAIRGDAVASGTAGSGSSGDGTFSETAPGVFTDVLAGDTLYISGEGQFLVVSVTDGTHLEVTTPFSSDLSSAHWRITRNGVDASDIIYAGPDHGGNMKWALIYDKLTFTNT